MHFASCGLILLAMACSRTEHIYKCDLTIDRQPVYPTVGKILPKSQIRKLALTSKIICAGVCLSTQDCKSVNYDAQTKECHLNNRTVASSSPELKTDPNYIFLNIFPPSCPKLPDTENGHFTNVPDESPAGSTIPLVCDAGYIPKGQDEAVCQDNGTWSSPVCASVSSCRMVKQYQPSSEDGEYWLRLSNFNNYTTRIYCRNMSASSPEEFLTLPNINYGVYPRIMNEFCVGEDYLLRLGCAGQGGEIQYRRIKVDIATMKVFTEDTTFANITNNGRYLAYGTAYDCYTPHNNNALRCGTRGNFTIDLRGTGWRVGEDQVWVRYRYHAMIENVDRQMNGTWIHLRCGGFGGGCAPIGGLFLTPSP